MTKAANIESIENATKLHWEEWLKFFNSIGAKDLAHREIADRVYEKLEGKIDSAGWWSQGVTVAYEQHIGRRKPGQRSDGTYEFSISKSMSGSMEDALQTWIHLVGDKTEFDGVGVTKAPATSQTDKRCHWGCGLIDGTRVNADSDQYSGKTRLSITHQKIADQASADKWKAYWQDLLADLG